MNADRMIEINWWVWAGLWLVAWFGQNVAHELSHLWTGRLWEGRKPRKLVPWPHRYQGRWYWARYESGPATRADAVQHEYRRHSAPLRWASTQVIVVVAMMIGSLLGSEAFGWCHGCDIAVYLVPFVVCPVVDAGVWIWGYWARRPGTDGDRWRQAVERR